MLSRIAALPRRHWEARGTEVATALTSLLRAPAGTMTLRPVQAVALAEAHAKQGLFGHIRVGAGKTLLSGLLPVVLQSKRPMLLVPASLVTKTLDDFNELRAHWKIPYTIRVVSYSKLGLHQHAQLIDSFQPDLIVADEAHKLRHVTKSAVARRVRKYLEANPLTRFCGVSGTLTKGSIIDYAHMLEWALRDGAPIPRDEHALAEWSEILDAQADPAVDVAPLVPHLGLVRSVDEAREAYQRRLAETPGVIVSRDSFDETPLTFAVRRLPEPPGVVEHLANLRTYWQAPDGWDLADARFEVWRVARQLALGFCYVHDPRPPADWFAARRAWCRFVRQTLEYSEVYDSANQVALACARGELPNEIYKAWKAIEPKFTPNTVPLWFDDSIIHAAAWWGLERPARSLIWIEHCAFGIRLAALTGWSYYREQGLDANGRHVHDAPIGVPAILSIESNATGRNLQQFNRSLVVSPLNQGPKWEQLIGRTHRDGQKEPVHVDTFDIVQENRSSLDNARREANYIRETTGQEQKLLLAERVRS